MIRAARAAATAAYLLFLVGPLGWQFLTSLWPEAELTRPWPGGLTLEAYRALLSGRGFGRAILNSLAVAGVTTALCLALAAPAAFAVAKLRLRGGRVLLAAALATSMLPPIATVSPLYVALRAVGLLDRLSGLVPPYVTLALPLALWLLTTSFREMPEEIFQAARVDGASPFQILRHVFLPLAAPGIASAAILVFVLAWNEFLYALTFVSTADRRTVPVAIALLAGEHREPWAEIAAASIVASAPVALLAALFQRRIVAGLTAGAVKE